MHQAIRAGNAEIAKAISPIDICSHRRCALLGVELENYRTGKCEAYLFGIIVVMQMTDNGFEMRSGRWHASVAGRK